MPKNTTSPWVTVTRPSMPGWSGVPRRVRLASSLQVLREGGAELDVGRGLDFDIEAHAAEQAGARGGGGRRSRGLRSQHGCRYRSASAARRPRCDTLPETRLREVVPAGDDSGGGLSGDVLRRSDADVVGIGGDAELHLGAAVGDEAGERDFAAAGFAGHVLDDRLRAVERDGPVGVREAVRDIQHIERRVLQLQAAVDDGLVGGAGDRGVQGDAAGREDVAAERFQDLELHVAVGAQVEGLRGPRWTPLPVSERSVKGPTMCAL